VRFPVDLPGVGGLDRCVLSDGRGFSRSAVIGALCAGAFLLAAAPAGADTFTVTNGSDAGAGSLRQAISDAEGNGNEPSADLIQVTFTGNIDLQSALDISTAMTITGPGASNLDVRRAPTASGSFPLFSLLPATGNTVTIQGLTISGARAMNFAGGGISMGGLGTLIVDSVVLADNQALGNGEGGAVFFDRGFTSIRNSTLSNNQASFGGAILGASFGADVGNGEVVNSTISGNSAIEFGGGIYTNVSHIQILSSTIVNNVGGTNDIGSGGGTYNGASDALAFSVANTLYAGNKAGTTTPVDSQCGGDHTSFGYNLRQTSEVDCVGFNQTGDAVFPGASMLGSLGSNGGPTPTIALLTGNPAIDAGNPATLGGAFPACPATDQRGFLRGGTAGRCDIGAFELNATPPAGATTTPPANPGPTGLRARAIRKCKKKFRHNPVKRRKCIKRAKRVLPV
jgi:hypothetical protein